MIKRKYEPIERAIKNASYLISEEYESLQDDDLKERYDKVLTELKEAIEWLKEIRS